jgi:hypothetical protein
MSIPFKINAKYTLVTISGMAITIRNEITIPGLDDRGGRHTYRHKGKKKEFYLPKPEDLDKQLVFEGHGLSFTVDSETNRFAGNAHFNFVTDIPEELKTFIEQKCLNPSPANFRKILYSSAHRDGAFELRETLLFTNINHL